MLTNATFVNKKFASSAPCAQKHPRSEFFIPLDKTGKIKKNEATHASQMESQALKECLNPIQTNT
jgi:hypothetical protein